MYNGHAYHLLTLLDSRKYYEQFSVRLFYPFYFILFIFTFKTIRATDAETLTAVDQMK